MVPGVHYSYIDMGDMKTWAVRQGMEADLLSYQGLVLFRPGDLERPYAVGQWKSCHDKYSFSLVSEGLSVICF